MKEIRKDDIKLICTIGFIIFVSCVTNFWISYHQEAQELDDATVWGLYEANPFQKLLHYNRMFEVVFSNVFAPGLLVTYYLYLRRKVVKHCHSIEGLQVFTNILFFIMLFNVLNDMSIVLGVLI